MDDDIDRMAQSRQLRADRIDEERHVVGDDLHHAVTDCTGNVASGDMRGADGPEPRKPPVLHDELREHVDAAPQHFDVIDMTEVGLHEGSSGIRLRPPAHTGHSTRKRLWHPFPLVSAAPLGHRSHPRKST